MQLWDYCKHMKENEAWGSPEKMNGLLVLTLDVIRSEFGKPLIVNCGWANGTGHATNSYHYKGLAADFHIEDGGLAYQAEKITYILNQLGVLNYGLGVYPAWRHSGFHLDLRPNLTYWVSADPGQYVYFNDKNIFLQALKS